MRVPGTAVHAGGHRFLARRLRVALLYGDAHSAAPGDTARTRAPVVGVVLAVLLLAGCAVFAAVRPRGELTDAPILLARDSGALYVRLGDRVHPVTDLASARLIVGSADVPVAVRDGELARTRRGPLVGIPGAPDVLPAVIPAAEGGGDWALCDAREPAVTTLVIGAPPPRRAWLLVTGEPARGPAYLLYDGVRAAVDPGDATVLAALGLRGREPRPVPMSLLDAVPEVPAIVAPTVPAAGRPGPAGLRVGSVVRIVGAAVDRYAVVLDGGLQPVGRVAADLVRATDSAGGPDVATLAPDIARRVPTVETLPVGHYPDVARPVTDDTVVCVHRSGRDGRAVTVSAAPAVPTSAAVAPVALAQADGDGPALDAVALPPGRTAWVRSETTGDGGWLVTDAGVRHGVPDAATATMLGLPAEAPTVPWALLETLPAGPRLDRADALVLRDVVRSAGPPPAG